MSMILMMICLSATTPLERVQVISAKSWQYRPYDTPEIDEVRAAFMAVREARIAQSHPLAPRIRERIKRPIPPDHPHAQLLARFVLLFLHNGGPFLANNEKIVIPVKKAVVQEWLQDEALAAFLTEKDSMPTRGAPDLARIEQAAGLLRKALHLEASRALQGAKPQKELAHSRLAVWATGEPSLFVGIDHTQVNAAVAALNGNTRTRFVTSLWQYGMPPPPRVAVVPSTTPEDENRLLESCTDFDTAPTKWLTDARISMLVLREVARTSGKDADAEELRITLRALERLPREPQIIDLGLAADAQDQLYQERRWVHWVIAEVARRALAGDAFATPELRAYRHLVSYWIEEKAVTLSPKAHAHITRVRDANARVQSFALTHTSVAWARRLRPEPEPLYVLQPFTLKKSQVHPLGTLDNLVEMARLAAEQ